MRSNELNQFIKDNNLTKNQIKDIKKYKRRKRSAIYAYYRRSKSKLKPNLNLPDLDLKLDLPELDLTKLDLPNLLGLEFSFDDDDEEIN